MTTLLRSMRGYWYSQCIYAAAKLGIADLLQDGPKTVGELAELTGSHPPSLYRLLRALASIGTFAEEDGRFVMTELAEPLGSSSPDSMRGTAIAVGEEFTRVWGELLYSVKTGQSAFEKVYRMPFFEYLAKNTALHAVFDKTMNLAHDFETEPIIASYDFSKCRRIADIGGGNGKLLSEILRHTPGLQGILFEQSSVLVRAAEVFQEVNVEDRCALVPGSFFDFVPLGADTYMLRNIIHDWDDEQAVAILRNVRRVLPSDGKVLILETVIPSGNDYFIGKFLDLTMLLIGGQERTRPEYEGLLEAADLRLERVIETTSELSIVEAVKA